MPSIGDDPKDLRIGSVDQTHTAAPVEAAQGVLEAQGAEAVAPAQAAGSPDGVDEIAQALAAGTIDAELAKAQLIDQAVAAQVPPGASPELVAEIRAEVVALLDADPVLEQLLRA